ncbi:MAG: DedA family protein [Gemmatimonadota bacterium]|nr:DedA family protein [Gemmatimonadota bacterium]MDH5760173.1 DedA family protein [Gemmatimonadota bacterium]
MERLLESLLALPAPLTYVFLAVGAALENVVPPVPADTFVLLGGFLSSAGDLNPWGVFLATWSANVASALAMYRVGVTHGTVFFQYGYGRHLLHPAQMDRMARFYARWGTAAILVTRFFPGLRSVVPVFAGVSRQRFWSVAWPVGVASAVWYGGLVQLGVKAGENLDLIRSTLDRINLGLLAVALVVAAGVAVWWRKTR